MFRLITTGILLFLLAGQTMAGVAARVQTLQSPVWLERQHQRFNLDVGDELSNTDVIVTGAGARLVLSLADGSDLKLGENARFVIEELQPPEQEGGVLSGVLNVLKGAFRFTTGLISQNYRRDLRVSVATATIGIRGTDVWGKAEDERDFVVLLEGSIEIEREGETVAMNEPLTLYMALKNQPAQPVQGVSTEKITQWAAETEPQAGQGVRQADGQWVVSLASYRDLATAKAKQAKLVADGIIAKVESSTVNGESWQRVAISHLASKKDAEFLAGELSTRYGFSSAWVMQRESSAN